MSKHPNKRIQEFLDLVAKDCAKYKQVNQVTEEMGITTHHLGRLFKDHGLGLPSDHLKKVRNDAQVKMVRDTVMSFKDIAEHFGYSNAKHHSNIYRAYNGLTPAQHRDEKLSGLVMEEDSDQWSIDLYVADIIKYLDENHQKNKDITKYLAKFPRTVQSLQRRFRETVGCTINQYLVKKQVEYAAELVRTKGYIGDGLLKYVKYDSIAGLNLAFKQVHGMNTLDYGRVNSLGLQYTVSGKHCWLTQTFVDELLGHLTESVLESKTKINDLRKFYKINGGNWVNIFRLATGMKPTEARKAVMMESLLYIVQHTRVNPDQILERLSDWTLRRTHINFHNYFGCSPRVARVYPERVVRRYPTEQFVKYIEKEFPNYDFGTPYHQEEYAA